MKLFKTFGLAALAALTAMAIVGASSAMATDSTALCDTDPGINQHEKCSAGHLVSHVHEETLSGAKALLDTNIVDVECDVLFLGDVKSAGLLAKPLIIKGNFTYTNCGSCTVKEENGPVEIKVLKLGHETSDVTGKGLVHVDCGFFDCLYVGTGLLGTGKGPLLASTETSRGEVSLTAQSVAEEGGSFFCPDTSKLTIKTTPLTATYITE